MVEPSLLSSLSGPLMEGTGFSGVDVSDSRCDGEYWQRLTFLVLFGLVRISGII